MKRITTVFLLFVLIAAGCTKTDDKSLTVKKPLPESNAPSVRMLAKDLDVPWNIIKHEDGFFISERPGKIVKITENGQVTKMPLTLNKKVHQKGEGGLLGFVLAPDFNSSKSAFIYHTYQENGNSYNRIVKIKLTKEGWVEERELLSHIPASSIHNGGRLKIGPDHKLYATAGDASVSENAQNLDSLSGKILRMNPDGSVPDDNPFPGSYVYSYGHRNPQGLVWTEDGKFYSAEHGSSAHDEVNLVEAGKNYGWPTIRGDETKKGMVSPLFESGEDTWAPSGMAYAKVPTGKGMLFIAGLRGAQIRAFDLQNHTSKIVFEDVGRLRDIIIQDGYAYVITNNTDGRGTPGPEDDRLLKLSLDELIGHTE